MRIIGVMTSVISKLQRHRNPAAYWRKQGARIGKNAEIYPSANFGSEPYLICVGDHVRINSGVQLITHDGGVWVLRGMFEELQNIDLFGQIVIGDNVHIGTNAVIMPGVTIGSNCIIGCGAIVTKDIPDNSVAVGVPARVIETVEEYKTKHMQDFDETKSLSPAEKEAFLRKKYGC